MKRFFECLVPVTACNLKCDYCYVIQEGRDSNKITSFRYTPIQMSQILTQDNLGGECFFSFCGAGETLFHPELYELVAELVRNGHYVNITTNGTYARGFEKLFELVPHSLTNHLLFSFSLHWLELNRKNLLDVFKDNVNKVRLMGCSFFVQFNLYDGYLPHLDEIREYCLANFGALPQVATTRKEGIDYELYTNLTREQYIDIGKKFNSPLFDFTIQNFNKSIKEFCYAGIWSYKMYLEQGTIKPCYCNGKEIDIYEAVKRRFALNPIGRFCNNKYCVNSSHFLSLGTIPSMYREVTYADLRDRKETMWFTTPMRTFLSHKLYDDNKQYNYFEKRMNDINNLIVNATNKIKRKIKKIML